MKELKGKLNIKRHISTDVKDIKLLMKTKYKYIRFEKQTYFRTDRLPWYCYNKNSNDLLCRILYYPEWSRYVAQFSGTAVYNDDCLDDISHFMKQL